MTVIDPTTVDDKVRGPQILEPVWLQSWIHLFGSRFYFKDYFTPAADHLVDWKYSIGLLPRPVVPPALCCILQLSH